MNGFSGQLNKQGVSFDGFWVYWTGKSVKAHFQWDIGEMNCGETKTIFVTVSTDVNPAGWQEYTSCGWYYLNSGATVKAIVESTGEQFSAESGGIEICVACHNFPLLLKYTPRVHRIAGNSQSRVKEFYRSLFSFFL